MLWLAVNRNREKSTTGLALLQLTTHVTVLYTLNLTFFILLIFHLVCNFLILFVKENLSSIKKSGKSLLTTFVEGYGCQIFFVQCDFN